MVSLVRQHIDVEELSLELGSQVQHKSGGYRRSGLHFTGIRCANPRAGDPLFRPWLFDG